MIQAKDRINFKGAWSQPQNKKTRTRSGGALAEKSRGMHRYSVGLFFERRKFRLLFCLLPGIFPLQQAPAINPPDPRKSPLIFFKGFGQFCKVFGNRRKFPLPSLKGPGNGKKNTVFKEFWPREPKFSGKYRAEEMEIHQHST